MPSQKYLFQLNEIISIDTLATILSHYSEATGLPSLVTDYRGKPVTDMKYFRPICKKCRETELCTLCEKCDAFAGLEASFMGKPFIYLCHMGFVEAAVPIIVDGNYVGAVFTGQAKVEDECMKKLSRILPIKSDNTIVADDESNRIVPFKKFEACAQLIFTMANHFAEIGARNIIQQKLNEQEIKLLQESRSHEELKKDLARLELKNIQSQINPHFLFNTLNTIHHLAILENAERTSETISALSEMLRWSLSKAGTLVTIGDEINYIQSYLAIKSVTLQSRVKVKCNFDDTCFGCQIPAYTLQPLVENAFVHGLEPKEGEGHLTITVKHSDERIVMEVEDDGFGMAPYQLENVLKLKLNTSCQDTISLGIRNVIITLDHYFGSKFQWNVVSQQGGGTKIMLCIPFWNDRREETAT